MAVLRRTWLSISLIFVFAAGGPAAQAVLLGTGDDGDRNTEPPPDDPGFGYVGVAGLNVVYVRNGWVVTANHVPLADVTLGGIAYTAVADSKIQLDNPGGIEPQPDLAVFKIHPTPPLAPLRIRRVPPVAGDPVVMIGRGRDRGTRTSWGPGGWQWDVSRAMRWGTNRVLDPGAFLAVGSTTTYVFSTEFSTGPPGSVGDPVTPDEAQATTGDSGGAAFMKSGATWELAGIMTASSTLTDQPDNTAIYGNHTFIADLSTYRDQILEIVTRPGCSDGLDDDGDGLVDFPLDPGCQSADDPNEVPG